jgi:alpha-beta hydrolase superfamily lysophospholipase
MTQSSESSSNMLLLPVAAIVAGGGVAALVAYKTANNNKTKEEPEYEYDLWGKKVKLGIEPSKFPTAEEMAKMEEILPNCQHGWFESVQDKKLLHYRKFVPKNDKPKAVVIYQHGLQAHSGVAFVTSTQKKLNLAVQVQHYVEEQGFALYGFDQLGHGYSEGLRMHIPNYQTWVDDYANFCTNIVAKEWPSIPLFLTGHSLGSTMTLLLAHQWQTCGTAPSNFRGMVVVAPAIVPDLPPPPVVYVLKKILAPRYPTWTPFFMPNPVSPDRIWRDEETFRLNTDVRYKEMGLDAAGKKLRLGTAVQCLAALEKVKNNVIPSLKVPFMAIHGVKDYAVPCKGTDILEAKAATPQADFRILRYEEGYHDLFADPVADDMMDQIVAWMKDRMKK